MVRLRRQNLADRELKRVADVVGPLILPNRRIFVIEDRREDAQSLVRREVVSIRRHALDRKRDEEELNPGCWQQPSLAHSIPPGIDRDKCAAEFGGIGPIRF